MSKMAIELGYVRHADAARPGMVSRTQVRATVAWRLWRAGIGPAEIGKRLGISRQAAWLLLRGPSAARYANL